ncbi:MAG TPA: PAS domain S-box protein [Chthonomonadaceae bacterium]|nr:PAS domain S-box protein [Chthonomonadaceae bacterium]
MELRTEAYPHAVVCAGSERIQEPSSRLEAMLTQRVRDMETLLQVLPIGIGITHDPQCNQIRVNPAFAQMLGLSSGEESLGGGSESAALAAFLVCRDGEPRPSEPLPMQRAASQGVEVRDVELEIACEGGTSRHVLASAAPLLDAQGALRGSVGAFLDITERKRLEATLQNSERRFRALVENCSDAIAILNAQGFLEYASPSSHRILGYAPGELIGTDPLVLLHPDDAQRVVALLRQLAEQPEQHVRAECRLKHKNGAWVWIEAVGANLLQEPAVRGLVINYRDITTHKRHEEEIEALNARLQRAMSETHHRVKNNLQIIAALIDMKVAEGKPAVSTASLKRIGQHIQALADIHDLLTQDARTYGQAEAVSVKTVLERLLRRIQAAIEGRGIHHSIAELRLPVRECTSLALLVNELISNAIKHGQGDIALVLASDGEQVHVEVTDNGPGFPAGFDSKQAGSTGLELVESVGRWDLRGKVCYENRHAGGASVKVEFPLPARALA